MLTLVNVDGDSAPPDDVNAVEIGGGFVAATGNPFRGAIQGGGDFTIAMRFRTEEQSIFFSSCPYDPCVTEAPNDTDGSNHSMGVFVLGTEEEAVINYDNWYTAAAAAPGVPSDGEWHFLVVTHDADGGIVPEDPPGEQQQTGDTTGLITAYLDGVPGDPTPFDPNLVNPTTHNVRIGDTQNPIFPYADGGVDLTGDIDEFRIYDRVLSHGEIVNLQGVAPGVVFYAPVDSDAELYTDEPPGERFVNFKDYSFLMDYWLTEQWFPPED